MVDNMALMYCGRFSVGGTQKAEADHETSDTTETLICCTASCGQLIISVHQEYVLNQGQYHPEYF